MAGRSGEGGKERRQGNEVVEGASRGGISARRQGKEDGGMSNYDGTGTAGHLRRDKTGLHVHKKVTLAKKVSLCRVVT